MIITSFDLILRWGSPINNSMALPLKRQKKGRAMPVL
jgi:hypothetical protein